MTVTEETIPPLESTRTNLFDPPSNLATLPAVSRMVFPSGVTGWVVTSLEHARALLSDTRLSADRTRTKHPLRPHTGSGQLKTPAGVFVMMDRPEHTRYRKML